MEVDEDWVYVVEIFDTYCDYYLYDCSWLSFICSWPNKGNMKVGMSDLTLAVI